jgi:hypothetical protein
MIKQELNVGDRVKLLYMDGETSIEPGTEGTVVKSLVLFGTKQYAVKWDNGSELDLISSVDAWKKIEPKKLDESFNEDPFYQNIDTFRFFKMKFFQEFLKKIRECGVTNMFGAAPYLYMGRQRMEVDFNYHNVENEICDDVLEMADQAQSEMINGVIKYMNENNKEIDIDKVNRNVRKFATSIVVLYMNLY